MAVRSDCLAGPVLCAALSTTTLFTVPPGDTWLVKRVCTVGGSLVAVGPEGDYIVSNSNGVGPVHSVELVANTVADVEVWWALDAGSVLQLRNNTVGVLSATVFGAKLEGVAP